MKEPAIFAAIAAIALTANAADERDASRIVKKYSETVACQLDDVGAFQKNQYKAIRIKPGETDLDGLGALFVVYWEGDVGCWGGAGTLAKNFTVVEHSGFASAAPVVRTDYNFPELELATLTSISGKNGLLVVKGMAYGPNDQQHSPTKPVYYTLKLVDDKFVKQ